MNKSKMAIQNKSRNKKLMLNNKIIVLFLQSRKQKENSRQSQTFPTSANKKKFTKTFMVKKLNTK